MHSFCDILSRNLSNYSIRSSLEKRNAIIRKTNLKQFKTKSCDQFFLNDRGLIFVLRTSSQYKISFERRLSLDKRDRNKRLDGRIDDRFRYEISIWWKLFVGSACLRETGKSHRVSRVSTRDRHDSLATFHVVPWLIGNALAPAQLCIPEDEKLILWFRSHESAISLVSASTTRSIYK